MCKIPNHIIEALNNLSCENVAEELGIEVVKHRALCFISSEFILFWKEQGNVVVFCL